MAYDRSIKARYFALREQGLSALRASQKVGIAKRTGERWDAGLIGAAMASGTTELRAKMQASAKIPDPRTFEQLPDPAKRALEDFNVFSELYLARAPVPWRRRVANQSMELLRDRSEKSFVVCNLPPGVGKSTLWTLDLPLWLLCGGGFQDPGYGRALRLMLGHASKQVSEHYVVRLRRMLELTRPYWDKEQRIRAERVLLNDFGRFKPDVAMGDESKWSSGEFLVAQLEDVDLLEKESTAVAVSMGSEFIGERCDYAAWDDLVTEKTSRDAEVSQKQAVWFEKEAETRVEPGGVLWLVGQRLGPQDLFRHRLNETWADDDNRPHKKYTHIVFPLHNESTCDFETSGEHRQWDTYGDGCLLDTRAMPWREVLKVRGSTNYRTIYQQEDTDPSTVLVPKIWLEGGTDVFGEEVPGCYDHDRAWMEHPKGVTLINYATVDVAAGGWWAIEWWAIEPRTRIAYLIWGLRSRLPSGGPQGFLDWDANAREHIGVMEKIQKASITAGQAIRVWIIEANAAQKHLFQYNHFDSWRRKYRYVTVLPHQTQKNKWDPVLGVQATLPQRYHDGKKRLPRSNRNPDSLNYLGHKIQELTTWPNTATQDTVMSDWFGENHLDEIIRLGLQNLQPVRADVQLPPYLERQQRTIKIGRS